MSPTTLGASPMEGSSSRSSLGRDMSVLPMATICCSPPESVPALWAFLSFRIGKEAEDPFQVLPHFLFFFALEAHIGPQKQVVENAQGGEDLSSFGDLSDPQPEDLFRRQPGDILPRRKSAVPWQEDGSPRSPS